MNLLPLVLRPATGSDFGFIWQLRCLTMKIVIEQSYGWEEGTQRRYAEESLKGQVVTLDDQRVGILTLADWGDQIHIVWMAIDPAYQGRGFGTSLLRFSQHVARAAAKPLTLQVLKRNPAAQLYTRCGFDVTDESDPFKLRMRWLPPEP